MGISQEDLDLLQLKIAQIKDNNQLIHIFVNDGRTKVNNAESYVVGVYKNFFAIKSQVKNYYEQFTIKYIDVLTKKVVITELDL